MSLAQGQPWLTNALASSRRSAIEPRSYVGADGRLDVPALLEGFVQFWREHGEIVAGRIDYPEVAPQLVLMAWLHRIVNGGGSIQREVGVGLERIDLVGARCTRSRLMEARCS